METERSGWAVGWSAFAGFVLITVGCFQAIAGFAGVLTDDIYVEGRKWAFQLDATAWGWIHLILGIVLLLSGVGIFTGNVLARTVGVIVAVISAVAAFMWLPWYPVWAIAIIALDTAVIWALTAHGRDIAEG